jgi:hypothetical protein
LENQTLTTAPETVKIDRTEIRVRGKSLQVPSVQIDGRTVITEGKWLKTAIIHDEELAEGESVRNPESFLSQLKQLRVPADIFTFAQKLPDTAAKHSYFVEYDNYAVVPISTYEHWFKKQIESSVQRAIRKAAKSGITVRVVEFDDDFLNGIVSINNETPFRQGKAFWHYQKPADAVRHEHLTYPERNIFLGAYLEGELIGYVRMVTVDKVASILQLLTMVKHYDKRPGNALIAKAVEVCEQSGLNYLMYCNFVYRDPESSLTEFKRRMGFEQVLLPRYFVPLTLKGKIALRLGLHRGLVHRIPQNLFTRLLKVRNYWNARKTQSSKPAGTKTS